MEYVEGRKDKQFYMGLIKEKQNFPFTQVANQLLKNINLSCRAKGLYAFLYSKPEGWKFSGRRLKKLLREGERAIFADLKELESAGYLLRKKNGTGEIDYYLFTAPKHRNGNLDNPDKQNVNLAERQSGEENAYSNIVSSNNIDSSNKRGNPRPRKMIDVKKFFLSKGLSEPIATIEAEKYWNHYESNGWKVGKNPMKNWKSAAAGWLARMNQFSNRSADQLINSKMIMT